jgi:hypothetical protein
MRKSVRKLAKATITKLHQGLFCQSIHPLLLHFNLHVLYLLPHGTSGPQNKPSWIQHQNCKTTKLQLHFRFSRKYAASTHYIHIRMLFNFKKLLGTPDRIYAQYDKYIHIWPEPFKTQMKQVVEVSRSCLTILSTYRMPYLNTLQSPEPKGSLIW